MDRKQPRHSDRFHPYSSSKASTPKRNQTKSSAKTSTLSVNELKKRIRDVKRLLNRADLPADARIVQERALAGYETDLKTETERRQRSEMIKKYHFVRFLDRKTATKEYKRLVRKLKELTDDRTTKDPSTNRTTIKTSTKTKATESTDQTARLERKIHEARISMNYTIYYPLTEKYISLYPHQKKNLMTISENDDQGQSAKDEEDGHDDGLNELLAERDSDTNEKPPMWRVVEKCTNEDTLDLLREGKLNVGVDGTMRTDQPSAKEVSTTLNGKDDRSGLYGNHKSAKSAASKSDRESKSRYNAENASHSYTRHTNGKDDNIKEGEDSDGGFFEE